MIVVRPLLLLLSTCWSTALLAGAPSLPSGLGGGQDPVAPALISEAPEPDGLQIDINGFLEARVGMRLQNDAHEATASIAEVRGHIEIRHSTDLADLKLTTDLLLDQRADDHGVDLETGDGFLDLREANALFRPADSIDVRLGRQILTWGTGDLIFINDLFPKDYQSFFTGRDLEYLKAPSDAIKVSVFGKLASLDIVYTPRFDADRYIDGSRISFFSPAAGSRVGRNARVVTELPDDWFDDDELALRLFGNYSSIELASYVYSGYWKSPAGSNPLTGRATFPRLAVYGASARGPLGRGIAHAELGFYDSRDDSAGANPLVKNSELRALVGYEQEIASETTMGLQYYLERMQDHDAYLATLPPGFLPADQNRHVLTLRLHRFALQQKLKLSLFSFWSPSDQDTYILPKAHYQMDDQWSFEAGGNLFAGKDSQTFFNQFERNSNVYLAVRYGFSE